MQILKYSKTYLTSIFFILIIALFSGSIAEAADGHRIEPGQTVTIDRHGICRRVHNPVGRLAIFVPVKTPAEWFEFITHHPGHIVLADCIFQYLLFDPWTEYTGNVGGRTGANNRCNWVNGVVDGTPEPDKPAACVDPAWAFMSFTWQDEIRDMIRTAPGGKNINVAVPWYFRDAGHAGILAANYWSDLLDGYVQNSGETGGLDAWFLWTFSGWVGDFYWAHNCLGGTSSVSAYFGRSGNQRVIHYHWIGSFAQQCTGAREILCACRNY